jgi:hypothetical protein
LRVIGSARATSAGSSSPVEIFTCNFSPKPARLQSGRATSSITFLNFAPCGLGDRSDARDDVRRR